MPPRFAQAKTVGGEQFVTGSDSLNITIRGGAVISTPPDIRLMTPYVLLEQEDWFEEDLAFLRLFLKPGMKALDIGASFGTVTAAMAQAVGPEGKVIAFEPTPSTAGYLGRSMAAFPQVECLTVALGRKDGELPLAKADNSELNTLFPGDDAIPENITVPVRRLSSLAEEIDLSGIDFVKLDAEGSEKAIVQGGWSVFAEQSPVVMFDLKHGNDIDRDLVDELKFVGYEMFVFAPGLGALIPLDKSRVDEYVLNLFAVKRDRFDSLQEAELLVPFWPPVARPAFDPEGPPDKRLAAWLNIEKLLIPAAKQADSLNDVLNFAKIAWALGRRGGAVRALGDAIEMVHTGMIADPAVVRAINPEFENIHWRDRQFDWVKAYAYAGYEKMRSFSSYFGGDETLSLLNWLSETPYHSPEMERRRQLLQIRTGKRERPEFHPVFENAGELNLNADFWH